MVHFHITKEYIPVRDIGVLGGPALAGTTSGGGGSSSTTIQNSIGIATNQTNITQNTNDISTNQTNITQNTNDISTNQTNISSITSTVSQNTSDISSITSTVSQNTSDIVGLTSDVNTLQAASSGGSSSSVDLIYPVGSIYITTSTANPNTIWLNTNWEIFGAGKTLIGIDVGDIDFNTVGNTGGEKSHTLTVGEIPSHTHGYDKSSYVSGTVGVSSGGMNISNNTETTSTLTTNPTGNGDPVNNLQPYIVTYMWKRLPN